MKRREVETLLPETKKKWYEVFFQLAVFTYSSLSVIRCSFGKQGDGTTYRDKFTLMLLI